MATINPSALQPGTQLTNAAASVYTVPTNGLAVIRRAVFVNVDTAPHVITVHRVPSGGTAVVGNKVISSRRLSPGESYVAPELTNMTLGSGDSIQALADANSVVNAFLSGFIG